MTDAEVYASAAMLGAASGLRTFSGPAMVSQISHSGLLPIHEKNINFLTHPASAQTSFVMAIAELVVDKLPNTPSRLKAGPLIARALAGGFSGAVLTSSRKKTVYLGAMAGALAAIGAAYGGYHLRRFLNKTWHIPDPFVALAEDATVLACGSLVINKLHASGEAT